MFSEQVPSNLADQLIGWVDRSIDRFSPWHSPGRTTPQSLQRFAELAIAYDGLEDSSIETSGREVNWGTAILAHLSDPAFGEIARSRLEWAWALLLPYLVMRKRGHVDDYHDATLAYSYRAGFPDALEVVPYRALDYAYFSQASGLGHFVNETPEPLLARTFAAKVRCSYLTNRQSAYALTHTIFYASSFGRSTVACDVLPNAAPLVDSLIIDSCINRNFDLLGELLICSLVLPRCGQQVRDLGFSTFLSTLDDSGCILPNDTVSARSFEDCYHTTLVGVILCAALTATKC